MKTTVIKRENHKTSVWSGGATTELFIWPENGDYAKREFLVRISSATVELEESVFTSLPGVERWLMTLDKSMKICHKERYERTLEPFQVEQFQGDWETRSYGQVRDLNLMLNHGTKGCMEDLTVPPEASVILETDPARWDTIVLISAADDLTAEICGGEDAGSVELGFLECLVAENPGEKVLRIVNHQKKEIKAAVCSLALKNSQVEDGPDAAGGSL